LASTNRFIPVPPNPREECQITRFHTASVESPRFGARAGRSAIGASLSFERGLATDRSPPPSRTSARFPCVAHSSGTRSNQGCAVSSSAASASKVASSP
jgi:hypothetical protein